MYLQARIMIKTALGQLVAAMALGGLLLVNTGLQLHPWIGLFVPIYYHLLMLGWATQLIGGVALWMFPPLTRERPRGDERLGWLAYAGLNSGLLLRLIVEPLHTISPALWTRWGLVIAAGLHVAAIWALVIALWPRVKGRARATEIHKSRSEPT
jgi:hypothetical protein